MGVAPSGVRAAAPHSAPARTPGVYAQRLYARTHTSGRTKSVQDAPTTNDHDCTDAEPTKHTQPFTTGKGFGVSARMSRQNAQRLCRTQSPQSVLIGIENLLYFYENRLFLQADEIIHFENTFTYQLKNS